MLGSCRKGSEGWRGPPGEGAGPQRGRQAGGGSQGQVAGVAPGQCWKSHGSAGLRGPGPKGAPGRGAEGQEVAQRH